VIEGNIASGKSTLCKQIKQQAARVEVYEEQTDDLFLQHFYGDRPKYAFSFQAYMLKNRLYQMIDASRKARAEEQLVLMDRGALGDTCFAKYNYLQGMMDDQEFEIYNHLCSSEDFLTTAADNVDALVYLDVAPEDCLHRVRNMRMTAAEQEIPIEYFQGLDDMYFELMLGILRAGQTPVLVMRWGSFGCTKTLLQRLEETINGERKVPKVFYTHDEHTDEVGESYPAATYDEEEAIDEMQAVLLAPGGDAEGESSEAPPLVKVRWNMCLEKKAHLSAAEGFVFHSEAYKRVVMFHLAQGHNVQFY